MNGLGQARGRTARLIVAALTAGVVRPAVAHPLGNNSIAHFSILHLHGDRLEVEMFLDIAEDPAAALLKQIDADGNGQHSPKELRDWAVRHADNLVDELIVKLDGARQQLRSKVVESPDGSGELPNAYKIPGFAENLWTLKLLCRFVVGLAGKLEAGRHVLEYEDATYPAHVGLKRVLLERVERDAQPGSTANVRVLEHDASFSDEGDPFAYELYDPFNMPDERTAEVVFQVLRAAPASEGMQARAQLRGMPALSKSAERFILAATPEDQLNVYRRQAKRIIGLLGTPISPWLVLLISVLCLGYGAAHALMPGHAKTAVGAYLISQHASYRHAVVLAATVTFTHTFFVVLVGLVIHLIGAPAGSKLQLWLGLGAGAMIGGMGIWLAVRGAPGGLNRHHRDHHHHAHAHGWAPRGGDEPVGDRAMVASGGGRISSSQIALLGITGGMVPCPAATYIMLFAISKNVVGLGLYAIAVFSLGLALALMAVGFLALSSRRVAAGIVADRRGGDLGRRGRRWLLQVLPTASGAVVTALGAAITVHYAYMLNTDRPLIAWLA